MTNAQKQCLLTYLGYDTGGVDGIWGCKSLQATEGFQRDFGGIAVDGIAGEETEKAMRHAVAYGMPEKNTTGNTDPGGETTEEPPVTGTFWDDIKHFTRYDAFIGCPCGKCGGFPAEPNERLMRAADAVRDHFGAPLIPTSTVRCPAHNVAVGGVWNSRHLEGRAMDFYVSGHGSSEVLAFVRTLNPSYAYSIDEATVHMDF